MLADKIQKSKYFITITATILLVMLILLFSLLRQSTVKVTVTPINSIVRINNAPIQVNDRGFASAKTKPGNVLITVEADNYIGFNQNVVLKPGKSASIEANLKKNPVSITDQIGLNQNSKISFISLADEDNSIFYLSDNGSAIYKAKVAIDNENAIHLEYNRKISNPPLAGIKDIIWSPNKDAAIFKKNDGAYFFDFNKYNYVSQEEIKFGENIGDIAWAPDNSKIAYYFAPPDGEKSLIFSNKTNSEISRVANFIDMNINNPFLAWSQDSEWLIVIPRNKDLTDNNLYLFNRYTRTFSKLTESGNVVEAVFAPDGKKIYYSVYSPDSAGLFRFKIFCIDIGNKEIRDLDLRALTSNIVFASENLSDIIVSTDNTSKGSDCVFMFNLEQKKISGFQINLPTGNRVNKIIGDYKDKIIYYTVNNDLYVLKYGQ